MLRKKSNGTARASLAAGLTAGTAGTVDRRAFLRRSGIAAGGIAAVAGLGRGMMARAEQPNIPSPDPGAPVMIRKTVCTHCSVGCTVMAEVQNGVWVGQEPGWDSPFNLGSHCAKGASVRELTIHQFG
jgi:formate dehydrogenase major subunit